VRVQEGGLRLLTGLVGAPTQRPACEWRLSVPVFSWSHTGRKLEWTKQENKGRVAQW